jgi:beta-lactamase superfamily II metal-dependent hydrolase
VLEVSSAGDTVTLMSPTAPAPRKARGEKLARIHFLDVGRAEYGDCLLLELAGKRVLIDGAHPGDQDGSPGHLSIPEQIRQLLGVAGEIRFDLLVVTHAHQDHIGCLPRMVADGTVTAEWALVADPALGYGRGLTDAVPEATSEQAKLVAALREEPLAPDTDEARLLKFLADAAGQEAGYIQMLATLEAAGTKVVRHGRDDPDELLRAFKGIGLRILGPSETQLLVCAEIISARTQDMIARVQATAGTDAAASTPELYRRLLAPSSQDAVDGRDRPGPPINLQSIVTSFSVAGQKILLAGDMQFADPQVADSRVVAELAALRKAVTDLAPFAAVKVCHHGSENAFDAAFLADLGGTALYGICAGESSTAHPDPQVLALLDEHRDELTWVRTDHNGLSTFELTPNVNVRIERGRVNDAVPNRSDAANHAAGEAATRESAGPAPHDPVEVITRIPAGVRRVTVTIDVDDDATRTQTHLVAPASDAPPLQIAGGRTLPPLLFATSRRALEDRVGQQEAAAALDGLRASGQSVLDTLAPDLAPAEAAKLVAAKASDVGAAGVVLLGGYGVVAAHRRDVLPALLRARVASSSDADDFIVWSDDAYGDVDGDGIAELPVSRIPDGGSSRLLFAALSAGDVNRGGTKTGVRNVARPFADAVFEAIPGNGSMARSEPTTFDAAPRLDGDSVYLMLHGDWRDATRYLGESRSGYPEAVNLSNVPATAGRVILAGCCWGALTVTQPAAMALAGAPPASLAPEASIALTFLLNGATAFVGCTGSHYSPKAKPYQYFGQPIHERFGAHRQRGHSPAEALLLAKRDYATAFPHGQSDPIGQAIEYKILSQFTCLGLGW